MRLFENPPKHDIRIITGNEVCVESDIINNTVFTLLTYGSPTGFRRRPRGLKKDRDTSSNLM